MTSEDEAQKIHDYAAQYDQNLETYERLASILAKTLRDATASAGIKTHSVNSRVKERGSFLKKVERKKYTDPFRETTDLVAVRVVTLFDRDLGAVDRAIRSCFDVVEREDKQKKLAPKEFGYTSIHYNCFLKNKFDEEIDLALRNIEFEVQARTVLTDAWASIEHYLRYKGKVNIPEEIDRDLSALNALLYLADKQFHAIVSAVHEIEARTAEAKPDELHEISLNLATIKGLLRGRFKEREASSDRDYSELVEQLNRCEYQDLKQVNDAISSGLVKAQAFEALSPPFDPATMQPTKFTDVGLARHAVRIADSKMNALLLDSVIDDVDSFLMEDYEGF
ncbi:GTP pyrophosphokinase family protein [Rhodococcus aetherivorans]|uniref:GTP pyrophosphokinase n=1 Tax=Rhodococcus aetherivorans TaxID=191292 RepID=UPI00388EEDD9